jgi:hypothetical protein
MKTIARYTGLILLLGLALAAVVQAEMQDEIQHLLQFVENSGCEFERNGTIYDSKEARAHIEKKYDYVRSYVDETEDFIKYAATESSISGRKYHVICGDRKLASADWLHQELSRYRSGVAATTVLKKQD